jgi:serine phosphatase RsbU (regulator of sigma subunit)
MPAPFHLLRRKSHPPGEQVESDVAELRGASLAAVYYARRKGRDFYDFLRVGPNRVLFALLECVGGPKDNPQIATAVRTTFRQVGPQAFAKEDVNLAEATIELCLQLNRTILETADKTLSCPAFAGCYEETLSTLWYVNAGHAAALVRDPAGVSELAATGLPLGLFSHATCDATALVMQPGAALVVVSRSIVEAKSRGTEFGLEAVKSEFRQMATTNAAEIGVSILARVREFVGAPPNPGNVTALALARSR